MFRYLSPIFKNAAITIFNISIILSIIVHSKTDENECKCLSKGSLSESCDFNGRCSCLTGFYGDQCNKKCRCSYLNNEYCDELGQCICYDGFYGPNCSLACNCELYGRRHPRCDMLGICHCKSNKWGTKCQRECECNNCSSITDACDAYGQCSCKANYRGKHCEIPCHCENSEDIHFCDSNGLCICKPGFYGATCDKKCICEMAKDEVCDINGYCKCEFGYYGQQCDSICDCDFDHSSGRCDSLGYCKCIEDWFGHDCNKTYGDCGILPETLDGYDVQIPINVENPNMSYYQPWVVKILSHENYICTGVIVMKNWVLTLRRCFTNENNLDYIVKTGDYSHWHRDIGERAYNIEKIVFQDKNVGKMSRMKSLALVKLGIQIYHPRKRGYVENSFSQSICVTGIPSFASVTDIGKVLFTGWYKRAEEAPSTMTSLSLNLIPNTKCSFALEYGIDEIICALVPTDFQTTSMDQYGAPISFSSGKHSLIGLWIKQDKDCSFNCLAYFVNAIRYSDWIANITFF